MTGISATYFDGRTSQFQVVQLHWDEITDELEITAPGFAQRQKRRDVTIESRLGRGPRFIRFADGGRCEVADNAALDAVIATWAPHSDNTWLHRLETSWPHVITAVLLLAVLGYLTVQFGLPWAARRIAFALPEKVTRQLGDQTLAVLDKTILKPSTLTAARQRELHDTLQDFLARSGDNTPYDIEFRVAGEIGANAFAMPSGVIVITDDLVKLAKDDREIVGVFAHECGHIQHRHALRAVLQNSAVFVVIALVTGDVSSATAFGGALPVYLLQNQFSRTFEREADSYAVIMMHKANVDPAYLGQMLERLSKINPLGDSKMLSYLHSHPPTPERIQAIKGEP